VLIVGVSTRAAAESAVRAGYDVVTVDAFGDLDQPAACVTLPEGRPWSAAAASRHARERHADAVVYLSNVDNDLRAVAALANGRQLWGNPPDVLRRARDPLAARNAFSAAGIDAPEVVVGGELPPGDWLVKPLRSGGGARVRRPRTPAVPRGCYAQGFISGMAGSVVFVAARGRMAVLGITRQLVGDAAFGASGFRYCGSLLCPPRPAPGLCLRAEAVARTAADAFGLVGVNGVDFIDGGRAIHPIEVNPRWTASMELVERARGLSVFGVHAAACTTGKLPADGALDNEPARVHGKAIVFARRHVTVGDTHEWLADPTVCDIPRPGVRIAPGQPVCTVLAHGVDDDACYQGLVGRAGGIYAHLDDWARAAA
jgi:predicted ATP-grasp superfamily ATP-dependent carboligase